MSSIDIHAVSQQQQGSSKCVDIEINYTCSAMVNGEMASDGATVIGGIRLMSSGNHWKISVPNCGEPNIVMWVACMEPGLYDSLNPHLTASSVINNVFTKKVLRGGWRACNNLPQPPKVEM